MKRMIKFKISGRAVTDDGYGNCSFLGRGPLVYEIAKRFSEEREVRYSYSGLFRNGKSSLFHEAARVINLMPASEYDGKTVAVCFSLENWVSADQTLLEGVIGTIHNKVRAFLPDGAECERYYQAFRACSTLMDRTQRAADYLEYLSENQLYIVLFMDEFQLLPNYEECRYQELSGLHNLPNMSIAYVGRLPFSVTVKQMKSFPAMGAFLPCDQEVVMGFSDDDIELFCREFMEQYEFDLSGYMEMIRYHCGRSPYLFALVGREIQNVLKWRQRGTISTEWFRKIFASRAFEDYKLINVDYVLKFDQMNGMDNFTRLQRIMIGPRIGIQENDMNVLREMGYIDQFDGQYYAITPAFSEWLSMQELTGELPVKMIRAERLLKHLIRSKAAEIIASSEAADLIPETEKGYTWSDFDRAILGMRLTKVPERANNAASYGRTYTLDPSAREKYAIWILGEHAQSRKADLLEVMLLKDRLAILTARWELFEPHLGGTADEWKDRLIHWCTARNPALHANDYLTKQDEAKCERCCDEFLRRIGPMFPDVG